MTGTDYERFLIEHDEASVAQLVRSLRRVAVLGIKPESRASEPAHYVPRYLVQVGIEVVPVPVYYPDTEEILSYKVFRRLVDVPGPIDLVDVFRRSEDVAAHLADILAAAPKAVWLQLGIRDDRVARQLAEAGIVVVQDRCLMVDHERYAG